MFQMINPRASPDEFSQLSGVVVVILLIVHIHIPVTPQVLLICQCSLIYSWVEWLCHSSQTFKLRQPNTRVIIYKEFIDKSKLL